MSSGEPAAPRRWEGVIRVQKTGPAQPVRSAAQLDPPAEGAPEEAPPIQHAWPVEPGEWTSALLTPTVVHSVDCPLRSEHTPIEEELAGSEPAAVLEPTLVEAATEPVQPEPEQEPVGEPAVAAVPAEHREPRVPASRREADPLVLDRSIGATLAAARRSAGLTHEQLARITRIGVARLVEFENDDYSGCPAGVFARGRLDSIARAVGVDPAPLLAEFDARHGPGYPLAAPAAGGRQPIRMPRNWSMVLLCALAVAAVYPVALLVVAVLG